MRRGMLAGVFLFVAELKDGLFLLTDLVYYFISLIVWLLSFTALG